MKITKILLLTLGVATLFFLSSCAGSANKANNVGNTSPTPTLEPSIDRTPIANANQQPTNTKPNIPVEKLVGRLHVGKTESYIMQLDEKRDQLAAYCFQNDSPAGRAILAACKNDDVCEFTGEVNFGAKCDAARVNTGTSLDGEAEIRKVKSAKKLARTIL